MFTTATHNFSVIDLPSHRPFLQEPIMIQQKPLLPDTQQYNRLRTSRSTHRLNHHHQRRVPMEQQQQQVVVKLSKSASMPGAKHGRVVSSNSSPKLPPLMMRTRSSSVTSSEISPSLSTISNSSSLRRNNSAESRTMTPPPRAPLPPIPTSSSPSPSLPQANTNNNNDIINSSSNITIRPVSPSVPADQMQRRPPSVATLLAHIPRPSTAMSTTETIQTTSTNLKMTWKHMMSTTTLAMSPKKRKQQMQDGWGYILAQDHNEQDRLVAQHYLLRMIFGGDFCAPGIASTLEAKSSSAVVLDIGCGAGAWTMEMASMFPKATFIGIDQDRFFPQDIKPKNCHFRQYNVEEGLPFPDNSIDYIYQRDMNWGLSTGMWKALMREYMRVLKPGGWVELVEPDLETQSTLPNECAMNDKILEGMILRQQNPYMARHLSTLLASNGFRRVQSQFQSLPLGWDPVDESAPPNQPQPQPSKTAANNNRKCSELSRLAASQHLFLLQSLRPWLSLVMDLTIEKFNNHIMGLPESWRIGQTYINWHCATAQKPYQQQQL
ncbi:S-adenosyl-L-methionine-dependent methyltransferase [Zychaea mexicana]|uniref:S-adenosyl-L-methionine-dependent methyltransferase n=1 Tax=Zychaea mexicana TaxID=64656 RepID=UPI0022FF0F14|nr:S-adenosyl-L-methionine-dependent methyltransferase [Zychaea mexicana]KAI9493886.1 S-adenosyl-L-methionine-dependent methyltransferase [Zychaea mexicana]